MHFHVELLSLRSIKASPLSLISLDYFLKQKKGAAKKLEKEREYVSS
jgi:hypothetical protein